MTYEVDPALKAMRDAAANRDAKEPAPARSDGVVTVDCGQGTCRTPEAIVDWALSGVETDCSRMAGTSDNVGSLKRHSYKRRTMSAAQNKERDLSVEVGRRIQDLREAKHIRPVDFARAAGFTPQYLWRLEAGQQNVTLQTISRVAIALGEPMSALLTDIEPDPVSVRKRSYTRKT